KLQVALTVVILLAQVGVSLLEPWWMPILIDCGLGDSVLPAWLTDLMPFLGPGHRQAIIVFAVLVGIGVRLLGDLLTILGDYFKSQVNEGMILAFQADLFNHLQRLSFSYHDQSSVGDSMYRLNNDTGFISTHLWGNFRHLLMSVLTLIGMFWVVLMYDRQLALLSLAVAPILYGSVWFYGQYFKQRAKRVKVLESEQQTIMQEVLSC